MGGPKDEEPPKLLSLSPENKTTNTKPTEIVLEFDEYIRLETPNKSVLITPRVNKDEMEFTANRNKVIINLNQELEDSTTYVFNFQKSIKDATEGNVPENLRLVFSTGQSIDSLQATGTVSFTFPQTTRNVEDVLVGLYTLDDTTNLFTGPPYYVIQADSTGSFNLENLKQGEYLAYAWQDLNSNNKTEDKTEPYAFLLDTVRLQTKIQGLNFILDKSNLSEFKIQRASPNGERFDVTSTKTPVEITINHEDLGDNLFYTTEEKTVRFYHRQLRNDSTLVHLQMLDSAGIRLDTALYLKFQESDRKKETPTISFSSSKSFVTNLTTLLTFNKPIFDINYDSLYLAYDSASYIAITEDMLSFQDSIQRTKLNLNIPIPDSLEAKSYKLYIGDSTFMDIENTWTQDQIENTFTKINPETLSEEIKITVNTDARPLIVQIINKKDEIINEVYLSDSNIATFQNIEAGTYVIRAIIDLNKNKRWDTSNLFQNRYAEPIYYLTNPESVDIYDTVVRGGWTLEVTIEPIKAPGIFPQSTENETKSDE